MVNEYSNKRKSNLIVIISCIAILLLALFLRLQIKSDVGENNLFLNFTRMIMVLDLIVGSILLTILNVDFSKKDKRQYLKKEKKKNFFKENKKAGLLISGDVNSIDTESNIVSMKIPTYCKSKKITLKHIIPDDCNKVVITFAANQYNEWKVFLKNNGELKYCAAEGIMKNAQFDFSQKVTKTINIPENKTYNTISINVSNPEKEEIVFNIYDLVAIRK